jgi:hypothetical protein
MRWAFDFERTYAEQSEGRANEEVLNGRGERLLGMWIWRAGDEAIRILRQSIETGESRPVPNAAVAEILDSAVADANEFLCRDFLPTFLEQVREGRIVTGDVRPEMIESIWREYGVESRARLFLQMVYANPLALADNQDFVPFVQRIAAVCTLRRVNDAAIAVFLDGRGLDEASADVEWFRKYMSPPTEMLDAISAAKKMALSERAAANAARGHAPRNEARQWIWTEWMAYRAESPNKSEFARLYSRRLKQERGLDVKEKTIREVWLRDPPAASKQAG